MDLSRPSTDPLNPSCRSAELWKYTRNKVFANSKKTTPNNAINTIYRHDLDITHIDSWRIVSDKKRDRHDNTPLQQTQYLTHYPFMIVESWAFPISKKGWLHA